MSGEQTLKSHKLVDGDLITYLPRLSQAAIQSKDKRMIQAKDIAVFHLVNLQPGQKLLLEIEPLRQSDDKCIACNITVKDGNNKQTFTDLPFRINSAIFFNDLKNEGGDPENSGLQVMA
ncbi:hypothetical protein [Dyadobacter sp. CY323]|uniref:hypothetical protein n=1 Tax=Dyadobacter sp. CY323 TaxID=2907302 RepID=UPI001F1F8D45|nr:hypothetical protein [Dyadobacter sp. CY323]MCE6992084.1 hypothetical protein [Dyadobacter sp. CY323]